MNLPNLLTVSRFFLAGLMMAMLFAAFPWSNTLALACFIVAGITDALDGKLARQVYGITAFGSLLDPLADKVLVCAAFVSFVELRLVPAWICVLILTREFLVTGLRVLAGNSGRILSAGRWGKHKTVWQILVIGVLLLGLALRSDILKTYWPAALPSFDAWFPAVAFVLAAGAALITLASGAVYFYEHRELVADSL